MSYREFLYYILGELVQVTKNNTDNAARLLYQVDKIADEVGDYLYERDGEEE